MRGLCCRNSVDPSEGTSWRCGRLKQAGLLEYHHRGLKAGVPCNGSSPVIRPTMKQPDRERLKERWPDVQALSGAPFRLARSDATANFPLHAAAKARSSVDIEQARHALKRAVAARTDQWIDASRLWP
jgi:hypothetical protein